MYIVHVQYDMSYMENQKSVSEKWKFVCEKLPYYNHFSMYIRKNKNSVHEKNVSFNPI